MNIDLTSDRLKKKKSKVQHSQKDQIDNDPIQRLLSVFFIYWELEAKPRVYQKILHRRKMNNYREMQHHQAKL